MIDDRVFLGYPLPFGDLCKIYPPTVDDTYKNEEFNQFLSLFTLSQEELDDAYAEEDKTVITPTPFQYLLINFKHNSEMRQIVLKAFRFFIREDVTVVPEMEIIIIGKKEEDLNPDKDLINPKLLTAENFFNFQNLVRLSLGLDAVELPDPDEDPRVARIKAKGRKRDRLKAKRKSSLKMGTLLAAICCMGIGITPLNIGEMSYANISWLIQMYKQQESYDIDIKTILAGGDSKKIKPKYWIKNLD